MNPLSQLFRSCCRRRRELIEKPIIQQEITTNQLSKNGYYLLPCNLSTKQALKLESLLNDDLFEQAANLFLVELRKHEPQINCHNYISALRPQNPLNLYIVNTWILHSLEEGYLKQVYLDGISSTYLSKLVKQNPILHLIWINNLIANDEYEQAMAEITQLQNHRDPIITAHNHAYLMLCYAQAKQTEDAVQHYAILLKQYLQQIDFPPIVRRKLLGFAINFSIIINHPDFNKLVIQAENLGHTTLTKISIELMRIHYAHKNKQALHFSQYEYHKLLASCNQYLSAHHPLKIAILNAMADYLITLGMPEQALNIMQQSMQHIKQLYGPHNLRLFYCYIKIANQFLNLRSINPAGKFLIQAEMILDKNPDTHQEKSILAYYKGNLAYLLTNPDEIIRNFKLYLEHLPANKHGSPTMLDALYKISMAQGALQLWQEAQATIQQIEAIKANDSAWPNSMAQVYHYNQLLKLAFLRKNLPAAIKFAAKTYKILAKHPAAVEDNFNNINAWIYSMIQANPNYDVKEIAKKFKLLYLQLKKKYESPTIPALDGRNSLTVNIDKNAMILFSKYRPLHQEV